MHISELKTPCVLLEGSRIRENLYRMQNKANFYGVNLRPHCKTHKSVRFAQSQIEHGAVGITVAKPSEAAVFAAEGIKDIRIAYPVVGQDRLELIHQLMVQFEANISFCVDTLEGAGAASDYFMTQGLQANVLIEVDCGYGRSGVAWNSAEASDFFYACRQMPGLNVLGILTHAGHSYHGPEHEAEDVTNSLARVTTEECGRMLSFACRLRDNNLASPENFEISIGSTPSVRFFKGAQREGFRITEIRPGNYIFNDAIQVALTAAEWQDCALTVLSTVVSKHRSGRGVEKLFLDAGKKILTSDQGYNTSGFGTIMYNTRDMKPLPHAKIHALSEEHGWVRVAGGATMAVGDRVRIVPNHACVVVNTQDKLYYVEGEEVVATINVDARGKSW
jgi:D-serine deaminase-like pyridoxal phosphate-dependent protein